MSVPRCYALFPILLIAIPMTLVAQKLPKVQNKSIYAPENVKVDGKANEWNQKYQAYHPNNRIYYTVSNDQENLYLIVKATEAIAVKKVLVDGLTLTFKSNARTKGAENAQQMSMTYPYRDVTYTGIERASYDYQSLMEDSIANKDNINLLINSSNRKALATFNKMVIKGIKGIPDSAIMVQSSFGIMAMAQFSNKLELTYEVAIPLKYLSFTNADVLSYNIRLNGIPAVEKTSAGRMAQPIVENIGKEGNVDYDQEYLNQPTDFWGVYTLAKKN